MDSLRDSFVNELEYLSHFPSEFKRRSLSYRSLVESGSQLDGYNDFRGGDVVNELIDEVMKSGDSSGCTCLMFSMIAMTGSIVGQIRAWDLIGCFLES